MNYFSEMHPNKSKALMLAKRQLSELVFDAVNLEGINFTLPEVQTLLDGITIGGRKLTDQQIAINQANAWKFIFNSVNQNSFNLSAEFSCEVHKISGFQEALEWGKFRSGSVTIAGTDYQPPKAQDLKNNWDEMISVLFSTESKEPDLIYDQAIGLFLQMARNQFFYDVNKRMGRFFMNGFLLSKGYPVINLPAKKQLEFNNLMLDFYGSNQMGPMISFMKNCLDPRVIEIMSET